MFIRLGAAAAAIASALLAVGCDDDNNVQQPGTGSGGGEGSGSGSGSGTPTPTPTTPTFRVTTIVTDATNADLVNPWGIAPSEGFFWIADNGTGFVSILDANGRQSDEYPASRFCLTKGVTGIVHIIAGAASAFMIDTGGTTPTQAEFIVAKDDGTLVALNDEAPSGGVKVVDSSSKGAVYLGVTQIDTSSGPMLLAADFKNARIDMFDGTFKAVATTGFKDPAVPAGWGPFNVMALGGRVYVAWAKQAADNPGEEEHGAGLGMVSVFDLAGNPVAHIDNQGFNAPWGMAIMNTKLADNTLLVGNLGDGHITAFTTTDYAQLGQLMDESGKPVAIDGLWGIVPGGPDGGTAGSLYWVAGPQDETRGAFGRVDQL